MADNLVTQSASPATVPAGVGIATRSVTYSGDAGQVIAPVGLVILTGADDAKVATDVTSAAPLPTRQNGGTTTVASVGASASNVTVLASNANRLRAWLYNNDPTVPVYIRYGANATSGLFTKKLLAGEFHVVEFYTGIIDAIWAAAPSGAMLVTELVP